MALLGTERDSDWYKLAQDASAKLEADNVDDTNLKAVKRALRNCAGGKNVYLAWLRYQEPARVEYQVFGNGYLVVLTGHEKQVEITTSEPRAVALALAVKYRTVGKSLEIREVPALGR